MAERSQVRRVAVHHVGSARDDRNRWLCPNGTSQGSGNLGLSGRLLDSPTGKVRGGSPHIQKPASRFFSLSGRVCGTGHRVDVQEIQGSPGRTAQTRR